MRISNPTVNSPRRLRVISNRYSGLVSSSPATSQHREPPLKLAFPSSTWTPAIRSSAEHGRYAEALSLYSRMHRSNDRPDPFAISAALKACARIPSKSTGAAIHAHVLKFGHHSDVYAGTALVDFYSKTEGIDVARKVFDEMPKRNVVTWNSILASHLKAGELESARRVFDEMPFRDVVSWNSIVSGYAKAGDMVLALSMFRQMPEKNSASWNGMISGYIGRGDVESARVLFDDMPERSNVTWVTMISGYSQQGDVDSAKKLYLRMEERDRFSWNAMIACYARNGRPKDALELFRRMQKLDMNAHLRPDAMTFSSVISACSQLGDLRFGTWVEKYMEGVGIELDDQLSTALIDLYAKCGSMGRAYDLFHGLQRRDIVSYSAMILGCGVNGNPTDAIELYKEMLKDEVAPNAVTFLGLLTAYNHAGLVEEGCRCFASMSSEHRISPSADHYAIMVDLLGRVGRLVGAKRLIRSMPMRPHVGVWGALLLACRLHGNVELGKVAAYSCFELEPEASGYYVLLANIYAEAGKWDEAKELRKVMVKKGLAKTPGCSWTESG